jgi:hypothetical protein
MLINMTEQTSKFSQQTSQTVIQKMSGFHSFDN